MRIYFVFRRPFEFIINSLFTLESICHFYISNSLFEFVTEYSNWLDFLSVVPFYAEVISQLILANNLEVDFSIIASSPDVAIFVMLRTFKVKISFKYHF